VLQIWTLLDLQGSIFVKLTVLCLNDSGTQNRSQQFRCITLSVGEQCRIGAKQANNKEKSRNFKQLRDLFMVEAGRVEFTFARKMPLIAVKKVSHCKDSTVFQ